MYNQTYLKLYILQKVGDIQREADSLVSSDMDSINRAYELQGKLDLLKELFEELDLNKTKEKVEYHDNI